MKGRNKIIQELRDMGVSDYERKKIRNLMKQYERENAYSRIEKLNQNLIEHRVRPQTLNYETVKNLLDYNVYNSAGEIIDRYAKELDYLENETTSEYEKYLDEVEQFLNDIGIDNANSIRNADRQTLDNIDHLISRYNFYKETGNTGGMSWAYEELQKITLELSL